MPNFWRTFIMKWCWILLNVFSTSVEKTIWFLFFILSWLMTFFDLQMLNNPCLSGINPTWLWHIGFFIWFWIWFASILLIIFTSIFFKAIYLSFHFVLSLLDFGIRVLLASYKKSFTEFHPVQYFGIILKVMEFVPL